MSLRVAFAWYYLSGMVGLRLAEAGLRAASVGLRVSLAWYYLSGMMGLRLAEAGLRAASVGLRMSLAWYLSGMVGLRRAGAGLRGPPLAARMVLFARDDGPASRKPVSVGSEDSQWSVSNWSKLTADKSSVATTACRRASHVTTSDSWAPQSSEQLRQSNRQPWTYPGLSQTGVSRS